MHPIPHTRVPLFKLGKKKTVAPLTYPETSNFFLFSGGRIIRVSGHNLDVVQEPRLRVTLSPPDTLPPRRRRSVRRRTGGRDDPGRVRRWRRIVPETDCPKGKLCHVKQVNKWIPMIPTTPSLTLTMFPPPVRVALHRQQLRPHPVPHPGGGPRGPEGEGQSPFPAGQSPFCLQRRGERSLQLRAQPEALLPEPERPQQTVPPQTRQHHLCGGGRRSFFTKIFFLTEHIFKIQKSLLILRGFALWLQLFKEQNQTEP